ncbi:sensor histidine kinase [Actinomadura luteofluorescens]|uniref:sensor histidine kinase n=1 Tax=Actinomadura luteofluorescens TaxID=46163 RepID=UPI003470FC06
MRDRFEASLPARWKAPLVAVALAALSPVLLLAPRGVPAEAGRPLVTALVVVQAAALWWLGARPAVVTAVAVVSGAALQFLVPAAGPGIALVVLSTFAWLRPARTSLWAAAGAAAVLGAAAGAGGHGLAAVLWPVAAVLAWSWGALGRAWAARRQAEARRAVLEERARIARELHDVLAHTVSVMVVQAAAADDVFDSSPEKARQAVRSLEASGREALVELRRFVRTVRLLDEETAAVPEDDALVPQPSLADLDRLAGRVEAAGLPVRVVRDGLEDADVPPGVALSAYRIVQESLTNALRHARATVAVVTVRARDGRLTVEVRDDGTGGGRPAWTGGSGQGVAGMRERAALLGGTLEASPDPAGGFRVRAHLPLEDPA